jgi:CubicO group peptidase (beta-lactamase class C family)
MASPRVFVLLALCCASAFSSPCARAAPRDPSTLEPLIRREMAKAGIPGLAVAVVRRGKPDYVRGFGLRAMDESLPVDADTLFKMNSVTKSMSATAIATEVERGGVQWSDRIVDLYPEFRLKDSWVTREVTIEDALSHRTGVEATDWMEDIPGITLDEAIRRMRHLPQEARFRADFLYDNFMYSVPGEAVGRRFGGWDRMMSERLFVPLGMSTTRTDVDLLLLPGELALCHECQPARAPKGLKALRTPINVAAPHYRAGEQAHLDHWRWSVTLPAGAVWSSARDMAQYLELHMNEGMVDGKRMLAVKTMRELASPRISTGSVELDEKADELAWRKSQTATSYSLGWEVDTYMGRRMLNHEGASIGYQSQVTVLPDAGIAVAVMANLRDGTISLANTLGMEIVDHLLGLTPVQWTEAAFEKRLKAEQALAASSSLAADAEFVAPLSFYVGDYAHEAYGVIHITEDGSGGLRVDQGPTRTGVLKPLRAGALQLIWDGVRPGAHVVNFSAGQDGQAPALELAQQRFVRQQDPLAASH